MRKRHGSCWSYSKSRLRTRIIAHTVNDVDATLMPHDEYVPCCRTVSGKSIHELKLSASKISPSIFAGKYVVSPTLDPNPGTQTCISAMRGRGPQQKVLRKSSSKAKGSASQEIRDQHLRSRHAQRDFNCINSHHGPWRFQGMFSSVYP